MTISADYQCRSAAAIGQVAAGAKRTFTGLNIAAWSGDVIGAYWGAGGLYCSMSGDGVAWSPVGDYCSAGAYGTCGLASPAQISLYGAGDGIDAGDPAIVRSHYYSPGEGQWKTCLNLGNPSIVSGSITSVEIFAFLTMQSVAVGTFYLKPPDVDVTIEAPLATIAGASIAPSWALDSTMVAPRCEIGAAAMAPGAVDYPKLPGIILRTHPRYITLARPDRNITLRRPERSIVLRQQDRNITLRQQNRSLVLRDSGVKH